MHNTCKAKEVHRGTRRYSCHAHQSNHIPWAVPTALSLNATSTCAFIFSCIVAPQENWSWHVNYFASFCFCFLSLYSPRPSRCCSRCSFPSRCVCTLHGQPVTGWKTDIVLTIVNQEVFGLLAYWLTQSLLACSFDVFHTQVYISLTTFLIVSERWKQIHQ